MMADRVDGAFAGWAREIRKLVVHLSLVPVNNLAHSSAWTSMCCFLRYFVFLLC